MMQAVTTTSTANAEFSTFRPIVWLRRFADAIRQHIQDRRDLMVLMEADDHLLRDLGLCRSDVPFALARARAHDMTRAG